MLTLHKVIGTHDVVIKQDSPAVVYEVLGLPRDEEAHIGLMHGNWQILRRSKGVMGQWTGEYKNPEEALKSLQQALDSPGSVLR